MKKVVVRFPNSMKEYVYQTELNLIKNAVYYITNEEGYTYDSPVTIIGYVKDDKYKGKYRTIVSVSIVSAPPKKDDGIYKVIFNEEKKTTVVVWKDKTKTVVKCQDGDTFDREKGLMACYMKRIFNNRGYYNDILKKYC